MRFFKPFWLTKEICKKFNGLKQLLYFDNWVQLIFNRIFFRKTGTNIYRVKKLELLVDHSAGDENSIRTCIVTPMYKRVINELELSPSLNILDLGANSGGFTLMLRFMGFEIKKVVAVELNPNTFTRLRFNLERNLTNTKCILLNAAVVGSGRSFALQLGRGSTSDNIYDLISPQTAALNSYKIDGITINDIYDVHCSGEIIDLCKMDIEGAENEVLCGQCVSALTHCKFVIMEIHSKEKEKLIVDKMSDLGFHHRSVPHDRENIHLFENQQFFIG